MLTQTAPTPPSAHPTNPAATPNDAPCHDWPAVLARLDRIESAEATNQLRATGRWTPGEILDHLTRFMRASIDGFGDSLPPLPLRLLGRLIKPLALSNRPTPKGIALKGPIGDLLLPTPNRDFEPAMADLRQQIVRVYPAPAANPYIDASPLLGKLSQAEWTTLHLKHFQHHLSFLQINDH